jgi:hypothetical protein
MKIILVLVSALSAACATAVVGGEAPPPPTTDAGSDASAQAFPSDVQGIQATLDSQAGTIIVDGYDFTMKFARSAGWRPVSYQMKNVAHARGCPGMELASADGIVVDPVRFSCVGATPSGQCSFATSENTGVDDPTSVEQSAAYASFDVTFHAGTAYAVDTTYTIYGSGRLVIATSIVPQQAPLPAQLKTGHIELASDFSDSQPVAGHIAWGSLGTCEVMGLGAAVSPTSLLLLGTNEGMVSENHPASPILRSLFFDVATADYNPYARAEAAQNPSFAVYQGGQTYGDGIDQSRGGYIVESTKGKVVMRTAGGSPSFRIDGWGNKPFQVSVAGSPVVSSSHPTTLGGFASVDAAGTLTLALRGDVLATDDIVVE